MTTLPPATLAPGAIRLRRTRPADAEALFECASDPDVARFMDWPRATCVDDVRRRIEGREERWQAGLEFHWVLTPLDSDRALGAIACHVAGHAAEVGFFVHRRHWRRGHATAAARTVVEWALATPELWRVFATCDVENRASARVLEKAGLELEGRLRRSVVRPNLSPDPRDAWLYARVR